MDRVELYGEVWEKEALRVVRREQAYVARKTAGGRRKTKERVFPG